MSVSFRSWIALGVVCCGMPAAAQTPDPAREAIGLLRTNCAPCHGAQNRTSGLSLASAAEILQGGNRGPAAKVGAPAESLLVRAIEQTGDLKMPPGRKLPA